MKPESSDTSDFFTYRTEPVSGALGAAAAFILFSIFTPVSLLQLIFFAFALGPSAWALIQLARRGHGVQIGHAEFGVQNALTGRQCQISYAQTIAFTNYQNRLIAAYQVDPPPEMRQGDPLALTQARPESHRYPRKRLVESAPLTDAAACVEALAAHIPAQTSDLFTSKHLATWAKRVRLRNRILTALVILATPLWVIIVLNIVRSVLSLGGSGIGR